MAYYLDLIKKPIEIAPRCQDYSDQCAEVKNHFYCWRVNTAIFSSANGYCPYVIGQKSVKRD